MKCPTSGCATAIAIYTDPVSYPQGLAVDATGIYFADEVTVMKMGLDGANPTPLATGQNLSDAIAIDGTSVYWTDLGAVGDGGWIPGSGSLMMVAKAGGTPATIASGQTSPQAIVVSGINVYWANDPSPPDTNGSILGCAVAGCNNLPTTLANMQSGQIITMAADAANVYWGFFDQDDGLLTCSVGGCGGMPLTVASQTAPFVIALNATTIYWTDRTNGAVWKLAK